MQIYNYSNITGEFLSDSTARLDPIGQQPMIPAYATLTPPPSAGNFQKAVFSGDAWTLVEDHRGRQVWNTETVEQGIVNELGPLPENVTVLNPSEIVYPKWEGGTWVTDRSKVLFDALDRVDTTTNEVIETSWIYPDENGQKIRLNKEDQSNYEGEKNLYAELDYDGVDVSAFFPVELKVWTRVDGSPIMLPMSDLAAYKTFIRAGKSHIKAKLQEGWILKVQLIAMTLEELLAWTDPRI